VLQSRKIGLAETLLLAWLVASSALGEETFSRPGLVINWWDRPEWRFHTYTEVQVSDSEPRLNRWLQATRLTAKPWSRLWLGVNYSLIEKLALHPATHAEFAQDEHRLELEALPRFALGEAGQLNGRVRVERRWKDNAPDDWRLRIRWEPSWPVRNYGPLTEVFTQVEYFHDLNSNRVSEWRFAPVGTGWRISEQVSLRAFYLFDTVRAQPRWAISHILFLTWTWNVW
jgi:Protein of unknown function (DUF2490)